MHVSDNQILIYTCTFCMFRIHVSDNENLEKVFPTGINRTLMIEDGVGEWGAFSERGLPPFSCCSSMGFIFSE